MSEKKHSNVKRPPFFNPTPENIQKVADAFKKAHEKDEKDNKRKWIMRVV